MAWTDDGEWYSVWITDLSTDESVWAGSLKFPLVGGTTAVKPPLYSTLEIYGRPSIRPIDIPEWYVSMRLPGGDGIVASSGDPGYSGFGKSPKANADVQYDRETGVLHFRIGGVTKMVGDGEPLRFQPTHTPIPANTPTPSPTDTPAPTNTPVPTNTPTPMPTNTPVPVVKLVLDAESTVVGYWSDGTADVEVTATLRNDGKLRLDRAQDITAKCMAQNDESRDCSEELSLSLPNGLAPASGSFTLRLPMGVTTLNFDYGESEPLALDIDVPERILGVDRKVLECYADRPLGGVEIGGETFEGCGGWRSPTVEKWLSDVPVKVWGTGDSEYIAVLEAVLAELAPVLGLEFEWVDSESKADLKAFVGVPRSQLSTLASALGFKDLTLVEAWGFASAYVNGGGEATSGYIVVWHTDLTGWRFRIDAISGVTIHEALHALGPIGHTTRPVRIDARNRYAEVFKLNSHPLVRPGMSMDEVRNVIVLSDELLDSPEIDPYDTPAYPLDLVWRTYMKLVQAGSASFRLSGGECDRTFGVKRGPIEMSIGDFRLYDEPELLYLNIHPRQFYAAYSPRKEEWSHWRLSPQGSWEEVDRGTVEDASSWWLWNGKLQKTILSVLSDGSPEDITIDESADGSLRIQVTLDDSYGTIWDSIWDWTPGDSIDLTLILNPQTYALVGYTWELHKDPDANPGECLTYKEVATNGLLGVDVADLLDDPQITSDGTPDDPIGLVWRAYARLEETGTASFRLSGGLDR